MKYAKYVLIMTGIIIVSFVVFVKFFVPKNRIRIISPLGKNIRISVADPTPTQSMTTEATIISVGDIFLHDTNINAAYDSQTKIYDFNPVFSDVAQYFADADLSTANLGGGTYIDKGPFATYPLFSSPITLLDTLQNIGLDLVFRTNHTMDFGVAGLNTTSDLLKQRNIVQIAAASEEQDSKKIYIYQKNDLKIAFLGYIYGMNGIAIPEAWMINLIDMDKIEKDINEAKQQADFIVVGLHWGSEYQREPSQLQKEQAQQIADFGADLIVGSHPHVIQPVYQITARDSRKVYVAYSLGNFYCDQPSRYTAAGVILKYSIEKIGSETNLKKISYIPTRVTSYNENGRYQFKILPAARYIDLYNNNQAPSLTESNFARLKQAYEDTLLLLDKPEIGFIQE